MPQCEVRDRIETWPYVRRCANEATWRIKIEYHGSAMTARMTSTEVLSTCEHHHTQAVHAGVLRSEERLPRHSFIIGDEV